MGRIAWKDAITGQKGQFIAETMKESLFDYSFDSNRVPSLNLHYFCEDYILTSSLVEEGIMREGNMVPLVEEFESIIKESVWLPKGISSTMLFFKNKNGRFADASVDKSLEVSTRSGYYLENAKYIKGVLEADDDYLHLLLKEIEDIIRGTSFTIKEKRELYFCLREFMSELINLGVSKTHLYNQVIINLFTDSKSDDDISLVISFLQSLLPTINEYEVIFGITNNTYVELKDSIETLREATKEEYSVVKTKYVAANTFEAYDPVSALEQAKVSFSVVLSVFNACKHDTNIRVMPKGMVRRSSEEDFHIINESKGFLSKNKNKNRLERKKWLQTAIERPISSSIISAFQLHNTALEIDDPQTQLLNLWTILELLISTKQDYMNRINYISNVLSSILCNSYYEKRLESLLERIKNIEGVVRLIEQEPRGNGQLQKLALILKDNNQLQQSILALLEDYPLELYRIEELTFLFSSRESLKRDYERHSRRLKWQIMRIYRNRCMIIHSGMSFSQLGSILENEHYYVDELLNYFFLKRERGMLDAEAVFALSRIKEKEHYQLLDEKSPFSDEDFISVIFDY